MQMTEMTSPNGIEERKRSADAIRRRKTDIPKRTLKQTPSGHFRRPHRSDRNRAARRDAIRKTETALPKPSLRSGNTSSNYLAPATVS
jgi:hypothetical protein